MKLAIWIAIITIVSMTQASAAEWAYPEKGPSGSGKTSLGKAGNFETYRSVTNERPEKVVLWYAKRLGLDESHGLVEKANAGFDNLKRLNVVSYNVVRDTDTEKWGALIEGTLSAGHAHVHIYVRPENDSRNDLTISIAQTPKGTAISVIQSVPKGKVAETK